MLGFSKKPTTYYAIEFHKALGVNVLITVFVLYIYIYIYIYA